MFGAVPFREKDYVVIPRGTTHRWRLDEGVEQFWVCFHTPGEIETPNRYRNRYGQLLEHAPYSQRDFHGADRARDRRGDGEFELTRARARRLSELRARPPSVRRRRLGRLRLPLHLQRDGLRAARRALPPAAAGAPDLPGPELRHLHVRAADARLGRDGGAAPLPPLEHPVRGGHVLRRRRLRRAQGRGGRLPDAAPLAACRTARSPGRSRRRWARSRPTSWRSCGTRSARCG